MIGFILITHAAIGAEMIRAIEEILKEKVSITCIPMDHNLPKPAMQDKIRAAIATHRDLQGTIILTDLFGATPSNLCGDYCAKDKVEIVTGCNLPMLIKAATFNFDMNVSDAAKFLRNYGCENIRIYPEH